VRGSSSTARRPSKQQRQDAVFTALAEPTRRQLLDILRGGDKPVHVLADAFRVTRPAISQHLRVLRDVGLVREQRIGRERYYRLHAAAMREAAAWIAQYEQFWDDSLDRLGAKLDDLG
jgi:DNA-binding transcriptional ArsR family regulator